ncbi:hypothetical protein CR513_40202, partial [Mucuna pruriens]
MWRVSTCNRLARSNTKAKIKYEMKGDVGPLTLKIKNLSIFTLVKATHIELLGEGERNAANFVQRF